MILQKCAICGSKKSRSIKNQEAKGLLSNLRSRTTLKYHYQVIFFFRVQAKLYKMNDIVNKFLLAGDKFMSERHLKQPGFTYSACGPFTKHKERIQKFKETEDTKYIYRNELDEACFNKIQLIEILKI